MRVIVNNKHNIRSASVCICPTQFQLDWGSKSYTHTHCLSFRPRRPILMNRKKTVEKNNEQRRNYKTNINSNFIFQLLAVRLVFARVFQVGAFNFHNEQTQMKSKHHILSSQKMRADFHCSAADQGICYFNFPSATMHTSSVCVSAKKNLS